MTKYDAQFEASCRDYLNEVTSRIYVFTKQILHREHLLDSEIDLFQLYPPDVMRKLDGFYKTDLFSQTVLYWEMTCYD